MKKWIATVLALVLALGLCSVSWAEGEPTKNGNVWTVTPANAQAALDGQYGSIDNVTIVLSAGSYGKLYFGRPTKYEGSNTEYYVGGFDASATGYQKFDTAEELVSYKADTTKYTYGCFYIRSMSNVTIKAESGATVAGLNACSGHIYYGAEGTDDYYDHVRDSKITDNNNGYQIVQKWSNITFEGITFTAKVNIGSSLAEAMINGVTFDGCTFNINNTGSGNQAIRFYSEEPTGKIGNLKVSGCVFNKCYQGVYAQDVNNVEVIGCKFDTTGHNAIAVQGTSGGTINIQENYITGAGDRAIRFGNIAADATVKANNNVMVNSGDNSGELFKAEALPTGAGSVSLENNYWDGRTVEEAVAAKNEAVRPAKTGVTGGTFLGVVSQDMMANDVEATDNGDGTYSVKPAEQKPSNNYYYYSPSTTTDTTKGSPKTFDAGVGVYAVTAVLSLSGMAWTAKKRY